MKILLITLALAISATAQQKPATKSTAKKTQQPKKTAAVPANPVSNAPPKDAKKIDDTHWRWVDPKTGKAWVYSFGGVSWIKEPEGAVELNKPAPRGLTAVDRGETVE